MEEDDDADEDKDIDDDHDDLDYDVDQFKEKNKTNMYYMYITISIKSITGILIAYSYGFFCSWRTVNEPEHYTDHDSRGSCSRCLSSHPVLFPAEAETVKSSWWVQ